MGLKVNKIESINDQPVEIVGNVVIQGEIISPTPTPDCNCKKYKGKDEGPCSGLLGLKGCGHAFNMHSRFEKSK
jgi:hypothetical protein